MYGTIELADDLTGYFSLPCYTRLLYDFDMYIEFKESLYETGNPSVIDELDNLEYLMKSLSPRQKEIVGLSEHVNTRNRVGYTIGTSLSTIKREIRHIKEVFSRLLPDF